MKAVLDLSRFAPSTRRRWGWIAATAALLAYAVFLGHDAAIAPSGADTSGYFNWARLLLEGRTSDLPRTIEGLPFADLPRFAYAPHGFVPDESGRLIPTYPIGLPLLFAAALAVAGAAGPLVVMMVHAVALVILTYQLARRLGAKWGAASLAAAAMAGSPLVINYAQQAYSDVPTAAWSAAALSLALSRRRGTALAAGLCAGVALLLRPTSALLVFPLLVALGGPRRIAACAAGGAPAAVAWMIFNTAVYGHPFATGYGSLDEFISSQWVGTTLLHYLRWLPVVATPLVILALAAPFARAKDERAYWAHLVWIVGLAGFYALYYFTHREWWYLRFLLPALPSLGALAAFAGEDLVRRLHSRWAGPLALALAATIVLGSTTRAWNQFNLRNTGPSVRVYETLAQLVRTHVPDRGVVLNAEASGSLFYRLPHVIVRWDALDDAWPKIRSAARSADRPIYAARFTFENEAAFRAAAPGDWRLVAQDGYATLWRLAP
jgi:hypothetical protein